MAPKKEIGKNSGQASRTRKTQKKPVDGILTMASPPSAEAKEIARYLADQIRYEAMTAAAAPLSSRFPKGSYASVMQKYLKNHSDRQDKLRVKAQAQFAAPPADQEKHFGRFAGKGIKVRQIAAAALDPALKQTVMKFFEKELGKHKAYNSNGSLANLNKLPIIKTKLRIDFTSGEFQGSNFYRMQTEINHPEPLRFDWESIVPEATCARWEMKFPEGSYIDKTEGDAGPINPGKFLINFHDFLSATPPAQPYVILIRVQPMKDAATAVGNPSNWVTVTYRQGGEQTQFDLPPEDLGHYQHIEFCINSVKCIEETGEWSASDEILLGGSTVLSGGKVFKQGVWTVSDHFNAGDVEPEPSHRPLTWSTFKLFPMQQSDGNILGQEPTDNTNVPWPKAFSFILIMVENDNGGFEDIIEDLMVRIIDYLQGFIEGIIEGIVSDYVGEEAAGIIMMVITALTSELFGWIKEIIDDPDDLLDQKTFVLRLDDSRVSYMHSLPGHVVNLGQVPGYATVQTEFVSNPQVFRFQGGDESDGGVYDVEVFWKANRRYFNYT